MRMAGCSRPPPLPIQSALPTRADPTGEELVLGRELLEALDAGRDLTASKHRGSPLGHGIGRDPAGTMM